MFLEDLNIFLKDFSQDVVFTLADNTTLTVKGIFDTYCYNPNIGGIDLDASAPSLTCIEAEISQVKKGDKVTINNKIYTVFKIHPDGPGLSLVILAR